MISQTQTASNQYGFYAVPKKLQPKKKYRQSEYDNFQDGEDNADNNFHEMQKQKVPEHTIQRDFYVDQAPYPEFKPKERGLDYGVQIQKGDLFDFDLEIQPLLEILIGRSVVSAINELQEQKEKVQKRQKLQKYQKQRNAELMVTQRLQAKNKRKKQESQRRVLQKQVHVKNQKQAGKKLIARKSAKQSLLGLKNQILHQLQQSGHLRSQTFTDLRIDYEGWLYDQIMNVINRDKKISKQLQKMVNQVENEKQHQHKKNIQKQKKRRQEILDERQRIKKLNQERKEKKRIKKQRLELNSQRQPMVIKFDELLQKHHQFDNIFKYDNRSNGLSTTNINTAYVSGGLSNFIVAILNSSQRNWTQFQVEDLLVKLLNESHSPLQFQFSEEHWNLIQQQIQKLNQNPNEFMNNKQQRVSNLREKISLSLKILELGKVHIKSTLHDSLLTFLLNTLLTSTAIIKPEGQSEELIYEPSEKDKHREQLKKKLQLNIFKKQVLEEIETILRVRFERKYHQESKKSQKPQNSQDEWVDIYDGQGWHHHCRQYPEQLSRQSQRPVAINIGGIQKLFVYDERILFFLKREVEKLLQIQGGRQVDRYIEQLSNISVGLKKEIPIYDCEVRIQ